MKWERLPTYLTYDSRTLLSYARRYAYLFMFVLYCILLRDV